MFLISTFGWWNSGRKLSSLRAENLRISSREMDEVLPEIAHQAWIVMHSTLFSISPYPPFGEEAEGAEGAKDQYWAASTRLGKEYFEALQEAERNWTSRYFSHAAELSPLDYSKAALSCFDEVLEKYRTEIDLAHKRMMKRYEGETMPVRNQDGFNWVKLW